MDINPNEYKIKIEKGFGLTHALKKLIEGIPNSILTDDKISASEWNATLDKLIEINDKRKENGENSIFTGGTDKTRNGWKNSFIVHEGQEITFTQDEMSQIFETLGVSFNDKPSTQNSEDVDKKTDDDNREASDSTPTSSSELEADSNSVRLPILKVDSGKVEVVQEVEATPIESVAQDSTSSNSANKAQNQKTPDSSKKGDLSAIKLNDEVNKNNGADKNPTPQAEKGYDTKSRLSWKEIGKIAANSAGKFVKGMFCNEEGKFSIGRTAATVGIIAGCALLAPLVATGGAALLTAAGMGAAAATTAANLGVATVMLAPIAINGGKKVIEGTTKYYSAETKEDAVAAMEHGWDGGVELASIPIMGKLFKWGGKLVKSMKFTNKAPNQPASSTQPVQNPPTNQGGSPATSSNNTSTQASGASQTQTANTQGAKPKKKTLAEKIRQNTEARKAKKAEQKRQAEEAKEAETLENQPEQPTQEIPSETPTAAPQAPVTESHTSTGKRELGRVEQMRRNRRAQQLRKARNNIKMFSDGTKKYVYTDNNGNTVYRYISENDQYIKFREVFYNKKGEKIKSVVKDTENRVDEYYYENELNTKVVHISEDKTVQYAIEYKYDSNKTRTQAIETDGSGNLVGTTDYAYDAKGHKILEVRKGADGLPEQSIESVYDIEGRLAKVIYRDSNGQVYDETIFIENPVLSTTNPSAATETPPVSPKKTTLGDKIRQNIEKRKAKRAEKAEQKRQAEEAKRAEEARKAEEANISSSGNNNPQPNPEGKHSGTGNLIPSEFSMRGFNISPTQTTVKNLKTSEISIHENYDGYYGRSVTKGSFYDNFNMDIRLPLDNSVRVFYNAKNHATILHFNGPDSSGRPGGHLSIIIKGGISRQDAQSLVSSLYENSYIQDLPSGSTRITGASSGVNNNPTNVQKLQEFIVKFFNELN